MLDYRVILDWGWIIGLHQLDKSINTNDDNCIHIYWNLLTCVVRLVELWIVHHFPVPVNTHTNTQWTHTRCQISEPQSSSDIKQHKIESRGLQLSGYMSCPVIEQVGCVWMSELYFLDWETTNSLQPRGTEPDTGLSSTVTPLHLARWMGKASGDRQLQFR